MPDNELSQETREQLELARSKVRRRISYVAVAVLAFVLIWGVTWMGERSAFTAAISICTAIIGYWFGWRSAQQGPTTK